MHQASETDMDKGLKYITKTEYSTKTFTKRPLITHYKRFPGGDATLAAH